MNKKTYLDAPSAELIVVSFEENILSGPIQTLEYDDDELNC